MNQFLRLALLVTAGTISALAADRVSSPIPMEAGTQWIYEARVRWTSVAGHGPPGIRTGRFKWTASVVESIQGKTARAAVVHAWPDEAGGMDPAQPDAYSVLLETGNRLYRLCAANQGEAGRLARQLAAAPETLPDSAGVYLDLPLTVDKRWGNSADDPYRADGWYCWHVEAQQNKRLRARGVPPSNAHVVFTVAFRTCPSHDLVEIVPGIGIVRFEFEHHGTVASSDVRLIEFKPPPARQSVK